MSRALLALLVPLLVGCYESSRPLGPPEGGTLDADLLGTWRCVEPAEKPKELAHLVVMRFDGSQYYLEWQEERKVDRYRAYTTRLNDTTLFNVAEVKAKPEAPKWIFQRVTARPDGSLLLRVVDRDAVKATNEAEAIDEIARRARDESLYKPWAVCTFEKRAG